MLETGINIIEWPSLHYCTMSAFGGDALQRKAMSHKSSFIIIDDLFFDRDVLSYRSGAYASPNIKLWSKLVTVDIFGILSMCNEMRIIFREWFEKQIIEYDVVFNLAHFMRQ